MTTKANNTGIIFNDNTFQSTSAITGANNIFVNNVGNVFTTLAANGDIQLKKLIVVGIPYTTNAQYIIIG